MNKKTIYSVALLTLGAIEIFFVFFIQAYAQKGEDIVPYLEERFKQDNIPVVEIAIIRHFPLHVRVTVQSTGNWRSAENSAIWESIQRTVFLDAHQDGYRVESLIGILQNNHGVKIDYTEQDAGQVQFDRPVTPRPLSERLADEETKELLIKKIVPLLDEYHLHGVPITVDVFSDAGKQTVIVELQVASKDVENAVFFAWKLPELGVFTEADAEGAHIFRYQPRVIDETGTNLTEMISFQFPNLSDDREIDLLHP